MGEQLEQVTYLVEASGEPVFETVLKRSDSPKRLAEESKGIFQLVEQSPRPAKNLVRASAPETDQASDEPSEQELRSGLKELAASKDLKLDPSKSLFEWTELLLSNGVSVNKLAEVGIEAAGSVAQALWRLIQDSKPIYKSSDEIKNKASRTILNKRDPSPEHYEFTKSAHDSVVFSAKDGFGMQLWRVQYDIDVRYQAAYHGRARGILPAFYVPSITLSVTSAEVLPGQAVNDSGAKMEVEPSSYVVPEENNRPAYVSNFEVYLDGDHKAMGFFPGKHFYNTLRYEIDSYRGLVRKF